MIDALQKQMVLLSDNIARAQERRNTVTQMANLQADLETELAELEIPSVARRRESKYVTIRAVIAGTAAENVAGATGSTQNAIF